MELKEELCLDLLEIGAVKFGLFTLKSGLKSPVYIDLRLLASHPSILRKVANALLDKTSNLKFDLIAGIPMAGIPIATAMALKAGSPMVFPRKEVKAHGTKRAIEGFFRQGQTVLVVDDLVTTGESKIEAITPLLKAGLKVRDICVLLDRQQGGKELLKEKNYSLHSVLTITELINILYDNKRITGKQFETVIEHITGGKK